MYFITAMTSILTEKTDCKSEEAQNQTSRCFGYYVKEEDARIALKNNNCDMHETMYDYAVIEKVEEGIHPISDIVGWFQYNSEANSYEPIEVGRTGICNYAIG